MRTKIAPILTALSLLATHLFLALVVVALPADATPQTVGDEACPKYAVNIKSFATCEGDRVVKPTRITLPIATREALPIAPRLLFDDEGNPLPSSVDAIPKDPLTLTHHGHYLTAREAHQAKNWLSDSVLFIDVRDPAAAVAGGIPQNADFNLPVMRRNEAGKLQIAYGFVGGVKRSLASRGLNHDIPIFVICTNARLAALAAELLAQAGVPHVFVVRGGINGEVSDEGASVGCLAARLELNTR